MTTLHKPSVTQLVSKLLNVELTIGKGNSDIDLKNSQFIFSLISDGYLENTITSWNITKTILLLICKKKSTFTWCKSYTVFFNVGIYFTSLKESQYVQYFQCQPQSLAFLLHNLQQMSSCLNNACGKKCILRNGFACNL